MKHMNPQDNELNRVENAESQFDLEDFLSNHDLTARELQATLSDIMSAIEWDEKKSEIGALANKLLPIEGLVPDAYADWRPFVRSAFGYIVGHLSPSRMIPKLIAQLDQSNLSLEQRIVAFISEMPTLQKLGQVIARNQELDPSFRDELIHLENSIRDVYPQRIFDEIREQLGPRINDFSIELEEILHSEASVGAVVRFSFQDPEVKERREGVFKVLKPNISGYFWEEMSIWDGLIQNLDKICESNILGSFDLKRTIDDIRNHLEPELDYRNEQTHLLKAKSRFSNVTNIRIPDIFPQLCSERITAMSYEQGTKIADAFENDPAKRHLLAIQLIELFIAQPLCEAEGTSFIHADPHSGNILVDESTEEIILLDWALVEYLKSEDRHQILLFVFGILLRDELMAANALLELSSVPKRSDRDCRRIIEAEVRRSICSMPIAGLLELHHATDLVDRISFKGVRFSKSLLVYRKLLLTLDGVLHTLDPDIQIASAAAQYAGKTITSSLMHLQSHPLSLNFRDTANLAVSLCWFGPRLQLNFAQRLIGRSS